MPAVAGWGTGSYDFLDCDANDCLMRHNVSVTVAPLPNVLIFFFITFEPIVE